MKTTFALYLLLTASMLTAQTARLVVPIGHTSGITSLAFSPDGKFVLTGSSDKTAKLWDRQGHELQTFSGHTGIVLSVAFSPLGDRVLTGSDDGTVKCWSLDGGVMQHFSMNGKAVTLVAFSSNGQIVLAGGHGTIKRWNLDGSEIQKSPMFTNDIGARMAFSPDGNSALFPNSELKAAQHWNLTTGASDPAIFDHENQAIYAAAFSPSGKTVLTAGEGNMAILWDLATGRKLHSLIGHTGAILSIAFSPDGKKVLTGGYDNTAILWDVATGQQIRVFSGFPYTINALAFSPACPDDPAGGKYALIGGNSTAAILWEVAAANKKVQTYTGHASYNTALAISPVSPDDPVGGKSILIGYLNNTAKRWNLADGAIKTLSGHTGSVFSVAFAPDGKKMLTGSGDKTAKLWSSDGDALNTFSGHKGLVVSVGFSPSGDTVLTGARDQTAKLWDLHGKVLKTFPGKSDFVNAVAFSPDGQKMLTGYCEGKADLWNLAGGDPKPLHGLAGCTGSVSFSPDGQLFLICDNESTAKLWNLAGDAPKHLKGHTGVVRSAVFSPDGRQVLTGSSDQTAKLWDLNATVLKTFSGHAGAVNSVAFSPNGKWVLTCGSMDQTVKLWNVQTGDLAATLIPVDSTDWVVTTPSGLFDASPGAMRLMHYVAELEVIELDQLKERYYEPGLLAKMLGFSDGTVRDVSSLGQVALYPEIQARLTENQINIQLTARSGGMGKLSLFINGKEVTEDLNPGRKSALTVNLNSYEKYFLPGTNTIAMRAYNSAGWLKSAAYELAYTPPAAGKGTGSSGSGNSLRNDKPHLYLIVVGTSNYSGDQLDLRFPDLDAKAMAEALQASGKRLFEARVHLKILTTDAKMPDAISSKKNIAAAFSAYAAQAKPTDILITYFSGHGLAYGSAEKSQFYYLTKDIASPDLKDDEVRKNYTVSSEDLTQWLTANPAKKQVMILDACNSGKVVESLATIGARELNSSQIRALDRMKDRTGMFILTGSAADKVSYEASQYGQGLLTYSLLQGMSGLALTTDKRVDVMTLFQYARDKVPELAKSIRQVQIPVLAFPTDGGSFDIGIVDAGVKIPLAQEKPVFIRNNLMNEATFFDELKITAALTEYFRQITAKGAQAEIIFVDVDQYENAYSIRGLYRINDEIVNLRGQLYKGSIAVGEIFQVSGQKDNIPALVEAIVDKVSEML